MPTRAVRLRAERHDDENTRREGALSHRPGPGGQTRARGRIKPGPRAPVLPFFTTAPRRVIPALSASSRSSPTGPR
jgi:hypothetical protein